MDCETLSAHERHIPQILQLLATQLHEHHVKISDEHLLQGIRGVFEDPTRGFFMVLERSGTCIGVAYVSFIWALEHGGRSAWLEELYVTPESRGNGGGTMLLNAVLEECRRRGCAALDLEIDSDHEKVRSLYERHGFHSLPRSRLVKRLSEESLVS